MNDRKERVYSEQDLCEYTILQKIEELERQLQNLKSETSLYETKEDASTSHTNLSNNIASVDSDLQLHREENVIKFRDIDNAFNHVDKFTPTDVGIKNNKLGLQNGSTWLTNRNAINLEGFIYDDATNTLKVSRDEGGGKLYRHNIIFLKPNFQMYFDVYSTIPKSFTFTEFKTSINKKVTCTGLVKVGNLQGQPVSIYYDSSTRDYHIYYIDTNGEAHATSTSDSSVSLSDDVSPVE